MPVLSRLEASEKNSISTRQNSSPITPAKLVSLSDDTVSTLKMVFALFLAKLSVKRRINRNLSE